MYEVVVTLTPDFIYIDSSDFKLMQMVVSE